MGTHGWIRVRRGLARSPRWGLVLEGPFLLESRRGHQGCCRDEEIPSKETTGAPAAVLSSRKEGGKREGKKLPLILHQVKPRAWITSKGCSGGRRIWSSGMKDFAGI